jgi:hypothetical protein
MSTPPRTVARPPAGRPPAGRSRLVLLVGVGIVVLYLAGAVVSGRASILARRPLLDGLAPGARALLDRADATYRKANGHSMSAAALAGFSGAWALFRYVLPEARSVAPADVAAAARRARVPAGGLPNGSGLEFAPPGGADAGANLRAASVIWEWTQVNQREVTWPPQFATSPIATIRPSR